MTEKVARIDEIIDALYARMLETAGESNVEEYRVNDGQMTIEASYRTDDEILKGIKTLERMRQMYINRLNGRMMGLRPAGGLRV